MNDESYVGLLTLYTRYPSEESGFRAGGADLHQFTIAGLTLESILIYTEKFCHNQVPIVSIQAIFSMNVFLHLEVLESNQ